MDIAISISMFVYISNLVSFSESQAKHKTFEESEFRFSVELGLIVKADQYMQGVPFVMWKTVVDIFLWLQTGAM